MFVDDFIKNFEQNIATINSSKSKPGIINYLTISEILTILIGFYQSSFDCFKNYYKQMILVDHNRDFKLVTYEHFTKLIGKCLPFLTMLLHSIFDKCTGISFVDSTSIAVCKNYRIYSHKVFKGLARRGKLPKAGFTDLSCT